MIGAQAQRTKTPGGFTSRKPKKRKHASPHMEVKERANQWLNDRGLNTSYSTNNFLFNKGGP